MTDLTGAMQIGPTSLYAAFGSKRSCSARLWLIT